MNQGTKEWAPGNLNLIDGCSHACRFCYARAMKSGRFKKTPEWSLEVIREKELNHKFRKAKGRKMYPSTHDITPMHIESHVSYLTNYLKPGNKVIIVSKPHFECIQRLCIDLAEYRNQILFRFTIGALSDNILSYWEPGAPSFSERLSCLKHAYEAGYATSISMEPLLDCMNVDKLINTLKPFTTESIWIGKVNNLKSTLKLNGESDAIHRAGEIEFSADFWAGLVNRYQNDPIIRWKNGIDKLATAVTK